MLCRARPTVWSRGPLHVRGLGCSRKHDLDGRMVAEPCLPQRMKIAAGGRLQGCRCEDMVEPAAYESSLALQVPAEFLRFVTVHGSENIRESEMCEST